MADERVTLSIHVHTPVDAYAAVIETLARTFGDITTERDGDQLRVAVDVATSGTQQPAWSVYASLTRVLADDPEALQAFRDGWETADADPTYHGSRVTAGLRAFADWAANHADG